MKWLILLFLVAAIFVIVAVRYRQQIKMAIYVWRMFRKMRQGSKAEEKQIKNTENAVDAALVRCAKCGTWTPRNKSLKFRSGINYCSKTCLEAAVNVG